MALNLCTLPTDCLRLLLAKVDYGDNKKAIWALSGSCKTVQRALKDCPAVVTLDDTWHRRQVLGICAALPKMVTLKIGSIDLDAEHCPLVCRPRSFSQGNTSHIDGNAYMEFRAFFAWLNQSGLRRLDLRWMNCWQPGMAMMLDGAQSIPEGLAEFHLPLDGWLNEAAATAPSKLGGLKHLACRDFWAIPLGLESLDVHIVSGYMAGPLQSCLRESLSRMMNLRKLAVQLDIWEGIIFPTSIQDLRVMGNFKDLGMVSTALQTAAPGLRKLGILQLQDNCKDLLDLTETPFARLRDLEVSKFLCTFPALDAPNLSRVCLSGTTLCNDQQPWLHAEAIARAAGKTSIKHLVVSDWDGWDDLRPLASLPLLTRLESNLGLPMLWHMLKPGCLQSLQVVALRGACKSSEARSMIAAEVEASLLALPRFRLLCCPWDWELKEGFQDPVEQLVGVNMAQWRCLYSKGREKLYERA